MKQPKNSLSIFMTSLLLLSSTFAEAGGQVKFSIVPVNGAITSLLIASNFTESVSYQVTNNTNINRTLTIVPMPGVTQVTTGSTCQNPFTLSPKQTCTLSLAINGSQIPASGINGGPTVCKTKSATDSSPDNFLCSQPDPANTLAVSVTGAGKHAYIANQLGNSVSYCQVNSATGLLSQCSVTATGLNGVEGIGFNPAANFFYSANPLNNTISVCNVNTATGALSACVDSGGTGFNLPNAIAFSPNGSILYTANLGGVAGISACLVNPTTGLLSSCVNNNSITFGDPADMAVNAAGTLAYVANRSNSTISVCNVGGQSVTSCNNLSGSFFDGPEGVTLSQSGLHAYISNANSRQIVVCDVLQDGTGLLVNCSPTNGPFVGTGNIGLNSFDTLAYVPNELLSAVFVCGVTPPSGQLSICVPSGGLGFAGPAGVVIQ